MKPSKTLAVGKIYGEYNKGPVKVGGEWNFDEEDQSVGWYHDQPDRTRSLTCQTATVWGTGLISAFKSATLDRWRRRGWYDDIIIIFLFYF